MSIHSSLALFLLPAWTVVLLYGCSTDPLTQRSRPMLVTEAKEREMGGKAFRQFLNDPKLIIVKDTPIHMRVTNVFARLVDSARRSTYANLANGLDWEVVVIQDDGRVGGFAYPGGKVGIYTGLVTLATTDAELAGAIGNNIGSILARHGAERMSRSLLTQTLGLGIFGSPFNSRDPDPARENLYQAEADKIGLLLAAEAGYDPDEVIVLWSKLNQMGTRLKTLEAHLPEARMHYRQKNSTDSSTAP